MSKRHLFFLTCALFLLSAPLYGQTCSATNPQDCIYVSTLLGGTVFAVDRTTGAVVPLLTEAGSQYEDLVVGPDNRLYACDPTNSIIRRYNLNGSSPTVVYSATSTPPLRPQCGRFSHTGDFYLNTKSPLHSGVWKITATALAAPPAIPVNIITAAQTASTDGEGLALAPNGDLLIAGDNKILNSLRPGFGSATSTTTSGLTDPIGLARDSSGNIYVSVGTPTAGTIEKCNPNVGSCTTFATFSQTRAYFLEFDAEDNLYVATSKDLSLTGGQQPNGRVIKLDSSGNVVFNVGLPKIGNKNPPAVGMAIPGTSRAITKPLSAPPATFSGTQVYNYGSHAFEMTADACRATVTARFVPPSDIAAVLSGNTISGAPEPYLGEGGFATFYDLAVLNPSVCSPGSLGAFKFGIAAFLDNFSNPRIIECVGPSLTGSCIVAQTAGVYPISQLLGTAGDPQIVILDPPASSFFFANVALGVGGQLGTFCGFQTPLANISDPNSAPTVNGNAVSVKFKLALGVPGNCGNGPFISSATALLSIARIKDAAGSPVFEPVNVVDTGQSSGSDQLFEFDVSNKQYSYSLSLKGLQAGTYSLSVVFLTSNTTVQTTFVKLP